MNILMPYFSVPIASMLLVDGSAERLEMTRQICAHSLGVPDIFIVSSGLSALNFLDVNHADLAVVRVGMGSKVSVSLVPAMRAIQPEIPIILLSAMYMNPFYDDDLLGFVLVPCRVDDLVDGIRNLFK